MKHKIAEVKPCDGLTLWVKFSDGEVKFYDTKPLIDEIKAFKRLENNYLLFNGVYVANGGYGIIWDDEIDLSSDELWHNGKAPA